MQNKHMYLINNKLTPVRKIMVLVWNLNWKFWSCSVSTKLINTVKSFLQLYLVKIVTEILSNPDARTKEYIIFVSAYFTFLLILEVVGQASENTRSREKERLDYQVKSQLVERTNEVDYYTLSTDDYSKQKEQALIGYSEGCLENSVNSFFSVLSNMLLLGTLIFSIATLGWIIVLPIFLVIIVRVISEYYDKKAEYIRSTEISSNSKRTKYLHNICENIDYAKDIRIFGLDKGLKKHLDENSNKKIQVWKKYLKTFQYSAFTYEIADAILLVLVYLVLAYKFLVLNELSVSDFVFICTAARKLQNTVGDIASSCMDIYMISDYSKDFLDFWEYKPNRIIAENQLDIQNLEDLEIEFRDVSFSYPNTNFLALSNVNIKLHRGESYLIVGSNGAGKSTFVKLLCRFYEPTGGQILLNGTDIRNIDRGKYLDILSVLFQDYQPLEMSIQENITSMGNDLDEARWKKAAGAADFISVLDSLPEKEHTTYGLSFEDTGVRLSGGETQKMMLAKALYKPAHIFIFDEATSGVDAISENAIYNNINDGWSDGIILYITHRLSVSRKNTRILLFSNGEIAETGTHDQLMKLNGMYATLFMQQAQMYSEGHR